MKVLKYTGIILVSLVILLYVLPAGLVKIPAVQELLAKGVAEYFEKTIGTEIEVERIEYRLFNKLALKNVSMQDQSGETLLTASRISAGIDLIPLFNNQFRINSVQLYTFDLKLRKETNDSPINIQYIIDAFASPKKVENPPIDLQIKNIRLYSGKLSLDIEDQPILSGKLDMNHLALENITAKINLNSLKNNELDGSIKRLSFTEKSGLTVKQISFDVQANAYETTINKLIVELPESQLTIEDIHANYKEKGDKLLGNMNINLRISPSELDLGNLSPILPFLASYKDKIRIQGDIDGSLNDLTLKNLFINEDYGSFISGNINVRNLTKPDKNRIYIKANLNNSVLTSQYIHHFNLPEELQKVGNINFNVNVSGYINNLNADLNLKTDIGELSSSIAFRQNGEYFVEGKLVSTDIQLNKILDNEELGVASFNLETSLVFKNKNSYSGSVDTQISAFEYQGHPYGGIDINGHFTQNRYEGDIKINSISGQLTAGGSVLLDGENSVYKISAEAIDIRLDRFKPLKGYENPVLSFQTKVDLKGNNFDNLEGEVRLQNVDLLSNEKQFRMDYLTTFFDHARESKKLELYSDILNAEIIGTYSSKTLVKQFERTLAEYLPSYVSHTEPTPDEEENKFTFHIKIGDTQDLLSILNQSFTISPRSYVSGMYDSGNNNLLTNVYVPELKVGKTVIDSCMVEISNRGDALRMNLSGINPKKNYDLAINADLKAKQDSIQSLLSWSSSKQEKYEGSIDFTTYFNNDDSWTASILLNQTDMVFSDSIWTIYPADIHLDSEKIHIDNLWAKHGQQYIHINGDISHNPDDKINVELESVDLKYLFEALNIPALEFGGFATGTVEAKDIYKTRELSTRLNVIDFSFNQTLFGDLDLHGDWDEEIQGINMWGHVSKNENSQVDIKGIIYPVKEELSIHFYPVNADLAFLRKYLNKVTKDISGDASGHVHLVGELNNPTVEGDVEVHNCRFGIDFLNTYYHFSDSVHLTPTTIAINNIELMDDFNNKAIVSGLVKHFTFGDFKYDARLNFSNFLVFNATEQTNPIFYGEAFGTGHAIISGTENAVSIKANIQNTKNTKMTLNFMEKQDVEEYNFITIVDKKKEQEAALQMANKQSGEKKSLLYIPDTGTELNLNLGLIVDPFATVEVIVDPRGGDKITTTGNGNLDLQYGTNQPLHIVGNYTIEEGKYNFSLEQLYHLNFDIRQGSTINFTGDPFNAELNVSGTHVVQANLADLNKEFLSSNKYSTKSKVGVDCIINLKGKLEYPDISFGIELSGSSSDLERQVKSYIQTEEMLNRQILYLLLFNRFYTPPEFAAENTTQNNADFSLLTSTLSSQLNNILSSISDNVEIGTQIFHSDTGDYTTTEVEVNVSSSFLNDRLIVYGNFGYIDNMYTQTSEDNNLPLVGDFDVEYKLTPSGDIRLKGYNHYNYRNFYSTRPESTQGIGILFRKDFNHILDLFRKRSKKQTEKTETPREETKE